MKKHLWKGRWIDDDMLDQLLERAEIEIAETLVDKIDLDTVIGGCQKLAEILKTSDIFKKEEMSKLEEISAFCDKDFLRRKVVKELGTDDIFDLKRVSYQNDIFETWTSLGVLAHVTPGNSPVLAILAVIEGLLAGNMNILKMSSKDTTFPQIILKMLGECEPKLQNFICVLRIGSSDEKRLKRIFSVSDGISVWGGDQAISGVKELAPVQTRIIPWGHKISFAYVTKEKIGDKDTFEKLAYDCVAIEQQACSSPQVIYVETDDYKELVSFADNFAKYFAKESQRVLPEVPSIQEQAEITNTIELCKLDSIIGDNSYVVEADDKSWRILVENSDRLTGSPLFRTIWVKPLTVDSIVSSLMPYRQYLQTVGLAAERGRAAPIAERFIRAGLTRVTPVGEMLNSYEGEPHDGVYALPCYMKKVRACLPDSHGVNRFSDIVKSDSMGGNFLSGPVMSKADFQQQVPKKEKSKLFFRSGGSSGEPALSTFSYEGYYKQMKYASEGLYAAGLSPDKDRIANLFFGGGLYGGFLSFFTILEYLKAIQYPIAAHTDWKFVGEIIVEQKINVLLGMPSYIFQLFEHNSELFKSYQGIEKIFYGGEHFGDRQRAWIMDEFGVKLIRSASYGSVDGGPLGFQCPWCEGGVHHLNHKIQDLEILNLENDQLVTGNEIGRLVFTSKCREAVDVVRYDIGDLGRWIEEDCPCGRETPRFELMGRSGDVFKAGGTFMNYKMFTKIVREKLGYSGEMQIIIKKERICDKLLIILDKKFNPDRKKYKKVILENYHDLAEVVLGEKCLEFDLEILNSSDFTRSAGSGKLLRVIDER